MDAVKFLSEASRMCGRTKSCAECAANEVCGFTPEFPSDFGEADQMQKMVKIVEKWAEEHPRKTLLSELLKRWPAVKKDHNGIPLIYPCIANTIQYKSRFGGCEKRGGYCEECRKEYWGQEVE